MLRIYYFLIKQKKTSPTYLIFTSICDYLQPNIFSESLYIFHETNLKVIKNLLKTYEFAGS